MENVPPPLGKSLETLATTRKPHSKIGRRSDTLYGLVKENFIQIGQARANEWSWREIADALHLEGETASSKLSATFGTLKQRLSRHKKFSAVSLPPGDGAASNPTKELPPPPGSTTRDTGKSTMAALPPIPTRKVK